MSTDYEKLEKDMLAVLVSLDDVLDAAERKEVRDFIDPGEYGLAFETLCSILNEKHAAVSPQTAAHLADLGRRMSIDEECWRSIGQGSGSS